MCRWSLRSAADRALCSVHFVSELDVVSRDECLVCGANSIFHSKPGSFLFKTAVVVYFPQNIGFASASLLNEHENRGDLILPCLSQAPLSRTRFASRIAIYMCSFRCSICRWGFLRTVVGSSSRRTLAVFFCRLVVVSPKLCLRYFPLSW